MAPSVNLALHLRLARILTGKSVAGEASLGPEATACLAVLDDLMVAMDERAELLRLPAAAETAAEETVVLESEGTGTEMMDLSEVKAAVAKIEPAPAEPEPEVEVEVEVDEAAAAPVEAEAAPLDEVSPEMTDAAPTVAVDQVVEGPIPWGRLHDQLYEDVLWLFKMGDNEGALNSLARLMDFGADTEELARFLTINREKLFDLYHRLVGEPDALVEHQDAVIGDRYFFQRPEVEVLLEQIDGAHPIGEVIEASALPDLKVYSYLHRIRREGLVRIHRSDA